MKNAMQRVEVEFGNLTMEEQERLYLSDKARFQNEAANSAYITIRVLVAKNEETSSEFLNAMLREELTNEDKQDRDVINAILANSKFTTMEKETRKICEESNLWKCHQVAAKDESSSPEFLNAMHREKIANEDKQDEDMLDEVLKKGGGMLEREKLHLLHLLETPEANSHEETKNKDKQDEDMLGEVLKMGEGMLEREKLHLLEVLEKEGKRENLKEGEIKM